MTLKVYRLPHGTLPTREPGSVGYDLYTAETVTIEPWTMTIIKLGVIVEPPPHWFVSVVPRSSTFRKLGVLQANSVGIIDPSYCGPDDELGFPAYNTGPSPITIPVGTKIAQLFLLPIPAYTLEVMDRPIKPSRGGFGSTGGYAA